MKKTLLVLSLMIVYFLTSSSEVLAQGSTTSRINGLVTSSDGEPLPGATIQAIHVETGSTYGTVSNLEGRFILNNLTAGGPYTVTCNFVGYEELAKDGIYLTLGQTLSLSLDLRESTTELEEVEITASGIIDGNRTGASTKVDERTINSSPTVARDLTDFTRLDPRASVNISGDGNSVSFAGINNRFNSIFIDGAVNNDLFGLAQSGTNGGQTGISPISVDALQEVQVVLAPYDVTLGGFAGGGINAVTRSGTNTLEGSAYYFLRNEALAGKTPTDNSSDSRTRLPDFSAKTYGFRLGGPVIKNKLFFFVNTEIQREETPQPFNAATYNGSANRLDEVANHLRNTYNYEPGDYLNTVNELEGEKVLAKINWNINDRHKLSLRHSYTKATVIGRRTINDSFVQFENSGQFFPSTTNSSALELKSNFSNELSNNLIVGYTTVRDDRDILGARFPNISINDGGAEIQLGGEPFSMANVVNQDVFTITNNLYLFKGKHSFTFGTHNEFYSIFNLFLPLHPAQYSYSSIDKFLADEAFLYLYGHEIGNSNIGDDATSVAADFNAFQLGFYAQDEYQVNDRLKITGGLRLDIPSFTTEPLANPGFNDSTLFELQAAGYDLQGARASQLPKTQLLLSPRLGFNFDVNGDKSTQLRGGIGVFTSRIPFVWPGGVYLRTGTTSGFLVGFDGRGFAPVGDGGIALEPNVNNFPFNTSALQGDVDLFSEDFKYPQLLRASLAVDQVLPGGLIGTVDLQYSKTLNNVRYQSLNRQDSVVRLEGTPDDRPRFFTTPIEPDYGYITLGTNTNEGYTFASTIQLQRPFSNGLTASVSYTFTRAYSLFDGRSFINSSQWQEFHSIDGRNNPTGVQRSAFDLGSRMTGFVSYQKELFDLLDFGITLFYNGQSGQPFSYVYNDNDGLLNGDDPNLDEPRNLIYVPASSNDIVLVDQVDNDGIVTVTAAEQWTALDAYIENDNYLSERRGEYAERNMARTPFEHIIDLKLLAGFFVRDAQNRKHRLEFTFDVFNFTNLLNKEWGRRNFVADNGNFQLIDFAGFQEGTNVPTFTFTAPVTGNPYSIRDNNVVSSRWQAQFGVRYSF